MSTPEGPDAGKRVLVAEDVKITAQSMTLALGAAGFDTALARDGEQCLEMVKTFEPDLVVLDLIMPKIHGIEVLRRLRSRAETQHIQVLVCTAKGFRTEVGRIKELGAAGLLVKPFRPKELIAKVEAILSPDLESSGVHEVTPAPKPEDEVFLPRLEQERGRLSLWGTRGSIPISGRQCIRHGGNTCCMELTYGDEVIIFDAGSGLRNLGNALAAGEPRRVHLFITHTHWDHIQGFPFFAPAWIPGFEIVVYGARGFNKDLEALLRGQLDPDYFPIQMDNMDAKLEFVYLDEGPIQIGGVEISWEFTQHPGPTLGYKIETADKKIAFVPDNEIFQGYVGPPSGIARDRRLLAVYQPIIDFLHDVDLLIHEAQYTPDEYRKTVRFGHSSVPNACFLAKLVRAKRWIVIHHDPDHSDEDLDAKLSLTRQLLASLECPIEVSNGYDGMTEYL